MRKDGEPHELDVVQIDNTEATPDMYHVPYWKDGQQASISISRETFEMGASR
jgi:hypothetical protein